RNFLVAYNINLNTKSVETANAIAGEIRESGIVKSFDGKAVRIPGKCKAVKAIGWYIDEYNAAQVSMNLTNTDITPLHIVFEEVKNSAEEKGVKVTGSELIGLIPLKCLIEAGKYFLQKENKISEDE